MYYNASLLLSESLLACAFRGHVNLLVISIKYHREKIEWNLLLSQSIKGNKTDIFEWIIKNSNIEKLEYNSRNLLDVALNENHDLRQKIINCNKLEFKQNIKHYNLEIVIKECIENNVKIEILEIIFKHMMDYFKNICNNKEKWDKYKTSFRNVLNDE